MIKRKNDNEKKDWYEKNGVDDRQGDFCGEN